MTRTAGLGWFAAAALLGGCQGCKDDHPYVPYVIGDAETKVSLATTSQLAPPPEEGGAGFAAQAASVAPEGSASWTLDGLALVAPEGMTFQLGLARDFDGDGAPDALAIARGKTAGDQGQVLYYAGKPGGGVEAGVIAGAPPPMPVPNDPTCSPVQRMSLIGTRSVFVEIGTQCAGHDAASPARRARGAVPSRWAAVVWAPARAHRAEVHLALVVSDPPGSPPLTLDADGSDYDGDGIDDVTMKITLDGSWPPFEAGPRVSATLRWIDRPAGMSREPDQPEASLHAALAGVAARAAKAKDAPSVLPLVRQVRALFQAMCAEGGAPRLLRSPDGRPIACGPPSHALEEAGLAETRALASTFDVLGAIAALGRAQQLPASRTPARATDAEAWIEQAAPLAWSSALRAISALPAIDHGNSPAWGAMAFEPTGKLLVRTPGGVVRVDPASGDQSDASDVAPWKAPVLSPDGSLRWNDVQDACDGSSFAASFVGAGDRDGREVLLPIQGRVGCVSPKGEPVAAMPVAWGPAGFVALVSGQLVSFSLDLAHASVAPTPPSLAPAPGGPRSPDGKTVVVPTSLGIVVRGAKTRLFRAKELDGAYLELRDCTVSDDGNRVACVRGGVAFVGIW
jgi:hypothetical protein